TMHKKENDRPDIFITDQASMGPGKRQAEAQAIRFFAAVPCPAGSRVWLARLIGDHYGLALLTTSALPAVPRVPGRALLSGLDFLETAEPLTPRPVARVFDLLGEARTLGHALVQLLHLADHSEAMIWGGSASPPNSDEPLSPRGQMEGIGGQPVRPPPPMMRPLPLRTV